MEQGLRKAVTAAEALSPVPECRFVLSPVPKLYVYDHCHYCVRARMLLGLKKIKHELVFLANDDFQTPISLVGKKMVPILVYKSPKTVVGAQEAAGSDLAGQQDWGRQGLRKDGTMVLAESLDIIKQIDTDESIGAGPAILTSYETGTRLDITQWCAAISPLVSRLILPRLAMSVCLPEFAFSRSREMFTKRHPLSEPSSYIENLKMTDELLPPVNRLLATFSNKHMQGPLFVTSPPSSVGDVTIDDIDIWPRLRIMTITKGIQWPPGLRLFLDHFSRKVDIPLLDDMAR
eukprot:GHVS01039905.1.p1 GENE.GHVS01039905.1~~GHVS01039905.1.p1  ORF type:complete len:290 (+),score=33.74 GHVS01039905.1:67-936(+)